MSGKIYISGVEWGDPKIISREIIVRRTSVERSETATFKRIWTTLLNHYCNLEVLRLESAGVDPKLARKRVSRGWAFFGGKAVDGSFHPVDISVSVSYPGNRPDVIEVPLVRDDLGRWEIISIGYLIIHPRVRQAYDGIWKQMPRPDPEAAVSSILGQVFREPEARELAERVGQRLYGPGIMPEWQRQASEFEGFWALLNMMLNLGGQIERQRLIEDPAVTGAVNQGLNMSGGKMSDSLSSAIERAILDLRADGIDPKPHTVRAKLGISISTKGGQTTLVADSKGMSMALRRAKSKTGSPATMSWDAFQQRVKDVRKRVQEKNG